MRITLLLAALVLAGCSGPAPSGPVDIRIVHSFGDPSTADAFDILEDAGPLDLHLLLANRMRDQSGGRCPIPFVEVALKDPSGAEVARLRSEYKPQSDCEYNHWQNATRLAPGRWTVEYSVGPPGTNAFLGSAVTVREASATADT